MILLENLTDLLVSIDSLEEIANTLTDRDIELLLCHDVDMKAINRRHRRKDYATDVLSFPLKGKHDHVPLGSIVISMDQVLDRSSEMGHLPKYELALLFVHGLLHLLGHDHEVDDGEMRIIEKQIIEQFELPDSLIIRAEDY